MIIFSPIKFCSVGVSISQNFQISANFKNSKFQEDVKLLIHCNLLCDVSKLMSGSPIEQLNIEMVKITQGGLTYEYMAQILQHKYVNFDLKKKVKITCYSEQLVQISNEIFLECCITN